MNAAAGNGFNNPAVNAGGALDIIVIRQGDGSLRSTAWHVVWDNLGSWGDGSVRVHINNQLLTYEPALRVTDAHEEAKFAEAESVEGSTTASGESMKKASTTPPPTVLDALSKSDLLRAGRNEICYTLGSDPHGYKVRGFLYFWQHTTPAIIFDIDGTITLNDIAGQAAMIVDSSPTHPGVCEFICALHARGYAIMYLTSRPLLGHAGIERTRRFLSEVALDATTGFQMPPAPVITTTHTATLEALAAELTGQSKTFKSQVLKTLREVFGPAQDGGGLYSGFGNREKDALAYLSAGLPPERVFLIDPSSTIVGRSAVLANANGSALPASGAMPEKPIWQGYTALLQESLADLFPQQHTSAEVQRATSSLAPGTQLPPESMV